MPPDRIAGDNTVADIMMRSLDRIEEKTDTLIRSDGEKTQQLTDLTQRLSDTRKIVDEHQALKDRAGGILVVGSMLLAFIGTGFWKIVDIMISRGT